MEQTFGELMAEGEQFLVSGALDQAAAMFETVLKTYPRSGEPLEKLGLLAYRQRDFDRAISYYERAVAILEAPFRSYLGMGDAHFAKRAYQDAKECFSKAGLVKPDHVRSYTKLGHACFANRDYAQAIAAFQQGQAVDPESWELQHWIGVSHVRAAEYEQGIEALRQAISLDPSKIQSYAASARALTALGRFDDARQLGYEVCDLVDWHSAREKEYSFTKELWFPSNVPRFRQTLGAYAAQPNVRALEIGCMQGMSACWLLDHILTHETSSLECIDPEFQPEFAGNIERTAAGHRVGSHPDKSQHVLFSFEDDDFDFAYIDGWHVAWQVLLDGLMTWPLIKRGGIVLFDDVRKADQTGIGQTVQLGVNTFVDLIGSSCKVLLETRQVVVEKLGEPAPATLFQRLANFLTTNYSGQAGSAPERMRDETLTYRERMVAFRDAIEVDPFHPWKL